MAPRKRRRPGKKEPNPHKALGEQLARFREAAGHTQASLAAAIMISLSKLESIEQGRRPLTLDLAQELDELLDTKGTLAVGVEYLPETGVFPVWATAYIDHEREAVVISWYENQVVPGLLQTEEYAHAVFRNDIPTLSEEEIESRVAARIDRQDILQRKVPPAASFVLSEAILRDRLGDDDTYRIQLRHLRECCDVPGIAIQILPLGRSNHAGLSGPFVLLETPEHDHLAYAETQRGSQLIHDPDEVSIMARKYAMLRMQALNAEETRVLLDELLGE